MPSKRTLALASRSKRLACLIFVGQDLKDWHCSKQGAKSPEAAAIKFKYWLNKYQPDAVVFEDLRSARRKGDRQQQILKELYNVARNRRIKYHKIRRGNAQPNRYELAALLGEQFPVLKHHVPEQPSIWQAEAESLVLFEALFLALPVIEDGL